MRLFAIAALLLAACDACHTNGGASPPGPQASAEQACAALAAIPCPEGAPDAGCLDAIRHIQAARLEPIDTTCIAMATTKQAAQSCGIKCQ